MRAVSVTPQDATLERFVRSFSSAVTRVFPGVSCAGPCLHMDRLREEFSELYGTAVRSDFAGTRIAGLFLTRVLARCASPELAKAAKAATLAADRLLAAMSSEDLPDGRPMPAEVFLWRVFGIRVLPKPELTMSTSEGFVIRPKPPMAPRGFSKNTP